MKEIDLKVLACLNYVSKMLDEMTLSTRNPSLQLLRRKLGKSLIELTDAMEKDDNGKE